MGELIQVLLSDLSLDADRQVRERLDEQALRDYTDAYTAGGAEALDPPQGYRDATGAIWLWDGYTRATAAKLAGLVELPVLVEPGTRQGALVRALCEANRKHGARLQPRDLRRKAELALQVEELASLSNVQLAERIGVNRETIRQVRHELEARGQAAAVAVTTKDGKTRSTSNRPAVQPPPPAMPDPSIGLLDLLRGLPDDLELDVDTAMELPADKRCQRVALWRFTVGYRVMTASSLAQLEMLARRADDEICARSEPVPAALLPPVPREAEPCVPSDPTLVAALLRLPAELLLTLGEADTRLKDDARTREVTHWRVLAERGFLTARESQALLVLAEEKAHALAVAPPPASVPRTAEEEADELLAAAERAGDGRPWAFMAGRTGSDCIYKAGSVDAALWARGRAAFEELRAAGVVVEAAAPPAEEPRPPASERRADSRARGERIGWCVARLRKLRELGCVEVAFASPLDHERAAPRLDDEALSDLERALSAGLVLLRDGELGVWSILGLAEMKPWAGVDGAALTWKDREAAEAALDLGTLQAWESAAENTDALQADLGKIQDSQYQDLIGELPDHEVATIIGVEVEAIAAWREAHPRPAQATAAEEGEDVSGFAHAELRAAAYVALTATIKRGVEEVAGLGNLREARLRLATNWREATIATCERIVSTIRDHEEATSGGAWWLTSSDLERLRMEIVGFSDQLAGFFTQPAHRLDAQAWAEADAQVEAWLNTEWDEIPPMEPRTFLHALMHRAMVAPEPAPARVAAPDPARDAIAHQDARPVPGARAGEIWLPLDATVEAIAAAVEETQARCRKHLADPQALAARVRRGVDRILHTAALWDVSVDRLQPFGQWADLPPKNKDGVHPDTTVVEFGGQGWTERPPEGITAPALLFFRGGLRSSGQEGVVELRAPRQDPAPA